jgi:hypothetical protein
MGKRKPAQIFKGDTFDPTLDLSRLEKQCDRVRQYLLKETNDCQVSDWRALPFRTIQEVCAATGQTMHTSISTRIRELMYPWKGGYFVLGQRRGAETRGEWEYAVALSDHPAAIACAWDANQHRLHVLVTSIRKQLRSALKNLDEMRGHTTDPEHITMIEASHARVTQALACGLPVTKSLLPTDQEETEEEQGWLDSLPEEGIGSVDICELLAGL